MRGGIVIAALLAGTAAHAQDNTTTTIPAPGIERYSLPPGNSQATPAPAPTPLPSTPTPSLTPAPPPSVVPTLQIPPRVPGATPTRAAPAARPTSAPTRTEAPLPVATPSATPIEGITPVPEPVPVPTPATTEPAIAPTSDVVMSGPPAWLWWAIGLVLVAIGGILVWRRFGGERDEPVADAPEPAVPAPAPTPGPPARPIAAPAAPQPVRALVLEFRPQRLWTRGPDAHLAFDLVVTNTGAAPADAVRPVIALASAGPETAAEIAAFNAGAQTMPGGEPFALAAGETRTVSGELTLPGDAMYVTSAADRELIVPVVLVSLQWRAGLSLARADEAYVIGTGDAASAKLGPIWVDRAGLVYARLDARRFTAGSR